MKNNRKSGFTLLEVLVVVAIAGMIMSFVMSSMTKAKQKSRDSRREQDMKQFQNALSLYVSNTGLYPICASEVIINGTTDCLSVALLTAQAMQGRVPVDPLRGATGTCGAAGSYVYCYQSANGFTYAIRYALETNEILGKSAGWQNPVGP